MKLSQFSLFLIANVVTAQHLGPPPPPCAGFDSTGYKDIDIIAYKKFMLGVQDELPNQEKAIYERGQDLTATSISIPHSAKFRQPRGYGTPKYDYDDFDLEDQRYTKSVTGLPAFRPDTMRPVTAFAAQNRQTLLGTLQGFCGAVLRCAAGHVADYATLRFGQIWQKIKGYKTRVRNYAFDAIILYILYEYRQEIIHLGRSLVVNIFGENHTTANTVVEKVVLNSEQHFRAGQGPSEGVAKTILREVVNVFPSNTTVVKDQNLQRKLQLPRKAYGSIKDAEMRKANIEYDDYAHGKKRDSFYNDQCAVGNWESFDIIERNFARFVAAPMLLNAQVPEVEADFSAYGLGGATNTSHGGATRIRYWLSADFDINQFHNAQPNAPAAWDQPAPPPDRISTLPEADYDRTATGQECFTSAPGASRAKPSTTFWNRASDACKLAWHPNDANAQKHEAWFAKPNGKPKAFTYEDAAAGWRYEWIPDGCHGWEINCSSVFGESGDGKGGDVGNHIETVCGGAPWTDRLGPGNYFGGLIVHDIGGAKDADKNWVGDQMGVMASDLAKGEVGVELKRGEKSRRKRGDFDGCGVSRITAL